MNDIEKTLLEVEIAEEMKRNAYNKCAGWLKSELLRREGHIIEVKDDCWVGIKGGDSANINVLYMKGWNIKIDATIQRISHLERYKDISLGELASDAVYKIVKHIIENRL